MAAGSFAGHRHRVLRVVYITVAVVALLGALAWAGIGFGPALPLDTRLPVMLACLALALLGGGAATLAPAAAATALPLVAAACAAVLGGVAAFSGLGLALPGLALLGLVVCLAAATGVPGAGAWATASALLVIAGLAAADALRLLPPLPDAAAVPMAMRLLMLCAAVGAGGAGGLALARLLSRQQQSAEVRERRFQALLGIAAAAYWETDAALRLRRVSWRDGHGQFMPMPRAVGRLPWAIGALKLDPDVADALRADMEGREPLRDLAFQWDCPDGSVRHLLASGQPRKDAQGRFLGYWGVARDVSAEAQARDALQATERRYQDLFARLPTALVVHRRGRILDANPAAARLLGYPSAARMIDHDLLAEHLEDDERRLAHARIAQLERLPPGKPLPSARYRMIATDGRPLMVRSLDARADGDGVPAMMTILTDETAAQDANRARQRAEAMFAQVLSTSPDVITLSDLLSGEFLMVNQAFCQLTGYAADEVVGRTAPQLGIWRDAVEHERLQQLLAERGTVGNVTLHYCNRQGQAQPLLVSATRFVRDGRSLLVVNARDLTDVARLRLEREAILANASVGIAFVREQRFELVNPQFERIYGWPAGTLTGQPSHVVWASGEEQASIAHQIEPALRRGDAAEVERQARRHDGSGFRVRLRAKALDALHPDEQGTIWIAEDVTRQREDEAALARARDEAQAASRAKSAFLANTSHEIRTPLNGLLGLARMARQPGVPIQRQRDYLDQIADSAEQLSAIISDILDLSKIEAGKLELQAEPFDLRELLHGLQQAYAALAAGHGLAFSVEIDRALPPRVHGDAQRVRQILGNFLHNALKYTRAGSLRLVVLRRPGDVVRFEVHDTGAGIDADTQQRLFQPFSQGDDAATRRHGGTGLGLSICRELATLMGGQVGVLSAPGRGSCFHAELPLPPAEGQADAPTDALADLHLLRGARVLLAEDNAVNMMIATALLEQWGVVVTPATDGPQALVALGEAEASGRPIQLVLMDVQMPGMDGYEVTELIRRDHSAQALPVIALTAAALVSERERAAASGMNGFITKPIDAQRLRRALVDGLKLARGAAEQAQEALVNRV